MAKAQPKLMHHSAEQATSELAEVATLVNSQVEAGMPRDEVVEALFVSWASRLGGLSSCSQGDKARITSALHAGPWSESQRLELARTILVGTSSATQKKKRANQKCTYIENFVPEEVWVKLKNHGQHSQLTRASLLAAVAHSIGIECPDQPTLYRMVSILAYCEKNYDMNQDEVHKLMDKIQSFIKGQARVTELPYLEHYPCSASGLPKEIQQRAYGSEGLPVEVDIPELGIILGDNKMRGRKKEQMPDWLQHVPEAYRGLVLQQMGANKRGPSSSSSHIFVPEPVPLPMPSAPLLRQAQKPPQPSIQLAGQSGELVASSPPAGETCKDEPAAEQTAEPEQKPGATTGTAEGAAQGIPTVEDLEEALLAGMLGTRTRKRPAASVVEPKSAPVAKKPAAEPKSASAVMKKPSSASTTKNNMVPNASNIDMTGIFAKLRARRSELDRKRYMSIAYHGAKTLAEKSGFTDDEAKTIARDVCARASAEFHKKH